MKKDGVAVESLSMYKDSFALLGIEPSFVLDLKVLDANYFALQCQWHPDRFVKKNQEEKDFAQNRSVQLNQAYGTLKDPLERAKSLMIIMGENPEPKQTSALLARAFEWQERLETADSTLAEDLQQERAKLEAMFQKSFVEKNQQTMQESYGLLVYCLKTLQKIDI